MSKDTQLLKAVANRWIKRNTRFVSFWIITVISMSITIAAQFIVGYNYSRSQKQILSYYKSLEQLEGEQSLQVNSISLSALSSSLDLNPTQKALLERLCLDLIDQSVLLSTSSMDEKYLTSSNSQKTIAQVSDLLELQFEKIQHEYESLQVWVGILTVIFLIFSFYSMFKVEDISQQARDMLNVIDGQKRQAQDLMDKMHRNEEMSLAKIKMISEKCDSQEGLIDKFIANKKDEIDAEIKNYKKDIVQSNTNALGLMQEELQSRLEPINERLVKLENRKTRKKAEEAKE